MACVVRVGMCVCVCASVCEYVDVGACLGACVWMRESFMCVYVFVFWRAFVRV